MSTAERSSKAIPIFRKIVAELRRSKGKLSRDSPEFRFLTEQMRGHQVTSKILCKGSNEVEHIAASYATYLHSTRQLAELQHRYKGGEKTVQEAANIVGLQIPERKEY
uniref:Protein FMC1 homolog n=1 Tax=Panagrellus redivivus TaxID=6233 RepID=A0A7E4WAS5_PANRE